MLWLLNVVRIVALILIGHSGYIDVALGGFHSKAGWLLFCAVALCAVWAGQHIPWFARDPSSLRGKQVNPSAPFLLPVLAVMATALITGLFTEDIDYFYPLRVVVGLMVLAWYREDYAAELERSFVGERSCHRRR
jgi:hypothetical protein